MRAGLLLPAGPIRDTIKEWMRVNDCDQESLAEKLEMNPRSIWRLLSGESKDIRWENADHLITKTVGPMHWHTEPALREIYPASFERLDLAEPLDTPGAIAWADEKILEAWDSSRTRGEAGEKLGMSLAAYSRILDPALKRAGRGLLNRSIVRRGAKKTHCVRNHDISVYGRDASGACKACRAESSRRRVEARRLGA